MRFSAPVLAALFACAIGACHANATLDATPATPSAPQNVPPGPTPTIGGNHETIVLAEGKYRGDLVIGGNHNIVRGAGTGKTIVDGRLVMNGNHNRVGELSVTGGGTIGGNHNDASGAILEGEVAVGGIGNRR